MRLRIEIELGNDAMQTGSNVIESIVRSRLSATGSEPFQEGEKGKLFDANGNNVGYWRVIKESPWESTTPT